MATGLMAFLAMAVRVRGGSMLMCIEGTDFKTESSQFFAVSSILSPSLGREG